MAARQPQDGEAAVALATVERRAGPAAPRHARPTRGGRGARVVAWLPACLAVAMGLAIRVEQYLHQRALWFDEGLLALNIIHRPYRRLFDPLAYHQGAPPGFLVAQRTAMHAFGGGEAALRLVPFLGGCLAVVVFAHLAHRVLSRPAALVATVLFALSPFLVYYSNEVQQYSTDALFTVLLLDLAAGLLLAPVRPRRAVGFGLAGAVAVLCSHPAVFVAAGASAVLVAVPLLRRDRVRSPGRCSASDSGRPPEPRVMGRPEAPRG